MQSRIVTSVDAPEYKRVIQPLPKLISEARLNFPAVCMIFCEHRQSTFGTKLPCLVGKVERTRPRCEERIDVIRAVACLAVLPLSIFGGGYPLAVP